MAQLELLVRMLQYHFLGTDFANLGIQQHLQLAFLTGFIDTLTLPLLVALERITAVRERDRGVAQLGDAGRRLERAVAAADDDDVFTPILFGIYQAIHDFGQFFAGNTEFARRAPPADTQ